MSCDLKLTNRQIAWSCLPPPAPLLSCCQTGDAGGRSSQRRGRASEKSVASWLWRPQACARRDLCPESRSSHAAVCV